jgi:hypothetical protein
MRAFARNTRNIFLTVILTTFLTAAPSGTLNFIAKFDDAGNPTANSIMSDNGTNVGIGTTNPTQRLTLGSGNILLPNPRGGLDGNLYFGGTTDTGQIGMRLFGGNIDGRFQSGFIDVRAGTLKDGLRFRVDTFFAGAERMRINAIGNVGIGTEDPTQKLDVAGTIRSSSGGFMFPDGTTQTTATLRGPQGPQGPAGSAGPPGPAVKTVAVCSPGGVGGCACNNRTVTRQLGRCTVTSETGSCFSGEANGCCAVCAP